MARKNQDPVTRVLAGAMSLAAEKGWRATTRADIAGRADLSLAEMYRLFPSKEAVLDALSRRVDAEVLAEGRADEGDPPRDRLFDVLMRRFDALAPYKAGLRAIWREEAGSPLSAVEHLPRIRRSMGWMLEIAGLPADGISGLLRTKGLTLVWLSVLRVWLVDDSADLSRTMAALDSRLRQAEDIWALMPFGRRRRSASSRDAGSESPASDGAGI